MSVWTSSLSAGPSLEDRLREKELRHLLHEQRAELLSIHGVLEEAKHRDNASALQRAHLEKLQAMEALVELQQRVRPEWLSGPATSIEHELARRRYIAEVSRLEGIIGDYHVAARPQAWQELGNTFATSQNPHLQSYQCRGVSPELASWPLTARPPAQPDPTLAFPRHVEVVPADVLVERKRRFGDRLFRLWVEDCANRGGVRVHAMDVLSLCRSHADLADCDIQAMFNHFVNGRGRTSNELARWIAGQAESRESAHDRELIEFLSCLLDAAYFELDDSGTSLELRLPAVVEAEVTIGPEEQTLIEVDRPQAPNSPLKAAWIREKLLVPRSVAAANSVGHHSRHSVSQSSYPSRASIRSSSTGPSGAQQNFAMYAAATPSQPPRRRPQSATRAAAGTRRGHPRDGVRASSRRPNSACHTRVSDPSDWSPCTSSLMDTSKCTNLNASTSLISDGDIGSLHSRHRLRSSPRPPQFPRPASALEPRLASACEPCATPGSGDVARRERPASASRSALSLRSDTQNEGHPAHIEAEPVPCPPSQPRPAGAHARRQLSCMTEVQDCGGMVAEVGAAEAESSKVVFKEVHGTEVAGVMKIPTPRHLRPTSAKASKHKRVADNDERSMVYEDYEDCTQTRQLRPTSAKASKHKRVADNCERSMVYEDYEDSEPDLCESRNDAFEIEVPLAEGHCAVPLLAPPRAVSTIASRAGAMEQRHLSSLPCRSMPADETIQGLWATSVWSHQAQGPPPLEPRASTPPLRPRVVA